MEEKNNESVIVIVIPPTGEEMEEKNKKPETRAAFRLRVEDETGAKYRSIPIATGAAALRAAYLPIICRRADVWVVLDPSLLENLVEYDEDRPWVEYDPADMARCLRRIWWGG
jgi:hypothetical protein